MDGTRKVYAYRDGRKITFDMRKYRDAVEVGEFVYREYDGQREWEYYGHEGEPQPSYNWIIMHEPRDNPEPLPFRTSL